MIYDETNRRHMLALADTDMSDCPFPLGASPGQDDTLSEERAAGFLGLTKVKLAGRRKRGTGPTVVVTRWGPRYRIEDLCDWAETVSPPR